MKERIKQIWERNGGIWLQVRHEIKNTLGLKISQQDVYDMVYDITPDDRIAPCGKEKQFKRSDRGYQFCSSICECAKSQQSLSRESTNLERYGSKNPMGNAEIRKRFAATMIANHGTEHALQSPKFLAKARATTKKNYGVEHSLQSEEVRQRAKRTLMANYDVDNPLKSSTIRKKIADNNKERFGRAHHKQKNIPIETLQILEDPNLLQEALGDNSVSSVAESLCVDITTFLKYWHRHGLPAFSQSSYENEIAAFLDTIGVSYRRNVRKLIPKFEIDFYIESHNLAIEFNGIYWHSSKFVDKDYHRKKYEACRDSGVRLLMINEDEWKERKGAWKSRLANILGKSKKGLAARKLDIRVIDQPTMNEFCNRHHVQGPTTGSTYCVGAFSDAILVAVMAFGSQRTSRDIELTRFCSDEDNHVGLFSKMFAFAVREQKYTSVLSFADLRHSNGDVYNNNGFQLVNEITPNYRYVWKNRTYHKGMFTKKRISERFDLDMSVMTEREAMEHLGIPRIYDCGKLKFVWRA